MPKTDTTSPIQPQANAAGVDSGEADASEPTSLWGVIYRISLPLLKGVGARVAFPTVVILLVAWYISANYGVPLRDSNVKAQERISIATEDMAKTTAAQAETLRNISGNEARQLEIQQEQSRQLSQIIENERQALKNHEIIISNQADARRDHQEQLKIIDKIDSRIYEGYPPAKPGGGS